MRTTPRYEILGARFLAPAVKQFRVRAPAIARRHQAGQFVIVRGTPDGERIPLTITEAEAREGWIGLVVQGVGKTTRTLNAFEVGDHLTDLAGPLGRPTDIADFGTVAVVGGGVGTAVIHPAAAALRRAGNRVLGILGARTRDLLILEEEMAAVCDAVFPATDDGSTGFHGFVHQQLERLLAWGRRLDRVLAAGPIPMMRAVAEVAAAYGVPAVVSLNPIMVDGTGMCGGCRISVGGETRFACVDGPEFDAARVDFDLLARRNRSYLEFERRRREEGRPPELSPCRIEAEVAQVAAGPAPPPVGPVPVEAAADLSQKERMGIPRQGMPEQAPARRAGNFAEVNLGFTEALARMEAARCLQCPEPRCVAGCPVGVKIRDFVRLVAAGDFAAAARVIKEDNSLPAVCGRVCPQETQCEARCVVGKKQAPIAIGHLERFVADFERETGLVTAVPPEERTGKRVAIVGSGPAGLACARDLALLGHGVTLFEALHEPGGVLVYGIPEFRLPKEVVRAEIGQLAALGVRIVTNAVIGKTFTLTDLLETEGHDALFLGVGAGLPRMLRVPGEHLIRVYSANEFLTRVNLMRAYQARAETPVFDVRGQAVAVFGGGNTAMDAARTALRLGAGAVTIIYRRSEREMGARDEEIHHAREEGIQFLLLTTPVEFFGDADGRLIRARLQKMALGEPDASGRRRPVPLPGSEYEMPVHLAIVAVGNEPNPLLRQTAPELAYTDRGTLVADPRTGRTPTRGVFAGGDIVTGGATVILAMGAGRRAARSIDAYLHTGLWDEAGAQARTAS